MDLFSIAVGIVVIVANVRIFGPRRAASRFFRYLFAFCASGARRAYNAPRHFAVRATRTLRIAARWKTTMSAGNR